MSSARWSAPHREWVLAALGVCIFSTVLGSMALPQKVAPSLLKGILVGVAVATLYRFLLQPYITTLPELLLSVAPFILIGGFARASKRFAIPAIDYNMGFLLASQAVLPAVTDPAAIWGNAFALSGVAFLVAGSFILLPRSPERQAMEAAETVRRDLRRLIERSGPGGDWHAQTTRQILRLTLHLGRAGELGMRLPAGMLAVLNLGYAIGDLRQAAQHAPSDAAVQRLVSEALELLMTCASVPKLTVARLRALMANVEDPALTEIMKNMTVALIEGSALLTFGLAAKQSVD